MARARQQPDHHRNHLLAALCPEDFRSLEPHLEIVKLAQGSVLYETGEEMPYAYFPQTAVVSLVTVLADRKMVEMAMFGSEAMFGLTAVLATHRSLGRYMVQGTGLASRIPTEVLHEAFEARPAMREVILRFVEALLAQALQSMACNTVHGVVARSCRWILTMQDRLGADTLPLTHEHLSAMLGVQRSTVSVVVRDLQTSGLIRQGRAMITVIDRPGLEMAVCECYGLTRRRFEQRRPPAH